MEYLDDFFFLKREEVKLFCHILLCVTYWMHDVVISNSFLPLMSGQRVPTVRPSGHLELTTAGKEGLTRRKG